MKLLGLLAFAYSLTSSISSGKERASIVLSVDNGSESVIFPVVNGDLPQVDLPQKNETFNSILGDMSVIGLMGLRTLTLDGLLPSKTNKYSWCYPHADNATRIINFVNKYRLEYVPMRLVICRGSSVYLNMACLIDGFKYYQDNVGDYHYTMNVTEYRMRNQLTGGLSS